ncbi:MAG TPA: GNAT family N-acetyltransferase [Gallicola sp.]|nr:GNAT family N-acetyltransferase [Gallicola sp.]
MKIENNKIVIRSAKLDDTKQLNTWWNDGKVMEHAGFPKGLGESLEKTKRLVSENENQLSQRCVIEIDSKLVGECSYRIYKNEAAIGIKICDFNYQNKGYGTELLKLLIKFLFEDENLNSREKINRIFLDTNLNNKRAQRVYEKIGFNKVGTRKNCWKDQLGRLQSVVDYEMTRKDYNNL